MPMDSASTAKRQGFNPPGKIENCLKIQNKYFQPMRDIYTLIMGLLVHSWFEIMEFSQILIIPAFWHWKIAVQWKWSNFSKKRQYFLFICVESNLTFCKKEIWSFVKVLDYQILKELINLRLKCSFLSLVQVTPKVHVTPFYGNRAGCSIQFTHACMGWLK